MSVSRRRFIAISAVFTALSSMPGAAAPARHWTGQALGARASILIDHPQAEAITEICLAEIDRLENILSLYRADSAISRLNRDAILEAPPFELLDCLAIAGAVHRATGGLFDPTVQPLWALWAEASAANRQPQSHEIALALRQVGWDGVALKPDRITLRPGMALTLNGIGQGYVADRIAALLEVEGLEDILIDTGEIRAMGGQPDGTPWPVGLSSGGSISLRSRALATSAPLGTTLDAEGRVGHILDPRSGRPAGSIWREISVSAPRAALADALSTAACLAQDREAIDAMIAEFAGVRIEAAI